MFLFRWFFKLVLAVVLILGLAYFLRDEAIRWAMPKISEQKLGVEIRAKVVRTEPFRGIVELKGVWMGNPGKFGPGQPMLQADRMYVDLQGVPVLGTPASFEAALFDIERLTIVRNSDGDINWKTLSDGNPEGSASSASASPSRSGIRFDRLDLSLKEIEWVDHKRNPPDRITIAVRMEHLVLHNVTGEDLAGKILAEAVKRSGGKVLKEFLNGRLLDAPDPLLRGSGKVLDKLRRTTDRIKDKLGL